MREGQVVAFTGYGGHEGQTLGDLGRVVSVDGNVVAVHWENGKVASVYDHDLAIQSRGGMTSLDDSLDVGGLVTFAAREAFDVNGPVGVVNALASGGHMAAFADIAEEALDLVASRVRSDPSIRAVTAQLDDEEGEAVIRLASAALIRDAYGEED